MFFELPEISQIEADVKTNWPVEVLPFDRTRQRTALRVALNAGVVCADIVHPGRIENVAACGMGYVVASWTVAAFASDVPLDNSFGMDVVVNGVTPVTSRPCGTLHVVWRIERCPPVGAGFDEVRKPLPISDIPLGRKREIVGADFCEVALLPETAVNEGNLVSGEFGDGVSGKVRDDCFGMLARITDDICHRCLSPSRVDLLVAFFAGGRADVVR